jgi:hypothetical protein
LSAYAAGLILSWVVIAILAIALSGLLRQVRILEARVSGGTGARRIGPGPGSTFPTPDGFESMDYLLIFADSNCASCREIIPAFLSGNGSKAHRSNEVGTTFIAYRGKASSESRHVQAIILENQPLLFERSGVSATPFAVRVVDGRVLAAGLVGSVETLREIAHAGSEREGIANG